MGKGRIPFGHRQAKGGGSVPGESRLTGLKKGKDSEDCCHITHREKGKGEGSPREGWVARERYADAQCGGETTEALSYGLEGEKWEKKGEGRQPRLCGAAATGREKEKEGEVHFGRQNAQLDVKTRRPGQ